MNDTNALDVVCDVCGLQFVTTYDQRKTTASIVLFRAAWSCIEKSGWRVWICPDCNAKRRLDKW